MLAERVSGRDLYRSISTTRQILLELLGESVLKQYIDLTYKEGKDRNRAAEIMRQLADELEVDCTTWETSM